MRSRACCLGGDRIGALLNSNTDLDSMSIMCLGVRGHPTALKGVVEALGRGLEARMRTVSR